MKLFELVHFCGQLPSRSRRLIILCSDFLISYLGFFLAELIIYKSWIYFANLSVVLYSLILPSTCIFFIYVFGIYRNKTKFITAKIIPNILFVSFLSALILFVFDWYTKTQPVFFYKACNEYRKYLLPYFATKDIYSIKAMYAKHGSFCPINVGQ